MVVTWWPLTEMLMGVLLLLLLPLLLPLVAIQGALWYRDPGPRGGQRLFALKFEDQDILLRPSQLPHAILSVLTCFLRCAPDVYVLGAAKSATSSLVAALATHEAIQTSHLAKETHYYLGRSFFRSTGADRLVGMPQLGAMLDSLLFRSFFPTRMARWWRSHFACEGRHVFTVEATPTLRFPEIAGRLAANHTSTARPAKAVILLRDPIDRAWSHYRMLKGHFPDWERRTFDEAVREELAEIAAGSWQTLSEACLRAHSLDPAIERGPDVALRYFDKRYLTAGEYVVLVPPFLSAFGRDSVLVVDYKDFVEDSCAATNGVCIFLGIAPFTTLNTGPVNVGKAHLKDTTARDALGPETLRDLETFFQPTVTFVQEEFGICF